MPIKSCNDGGKKYGDSGKCYKGKDAEAKAKKQAAAINISKARAKGHVIPKKGK